jgi:hypothetical protein
MQAFRIAALRAAIVGAGLAILLLLFFVVFGPAREIAREPSLAVLILFSGLVTGVLTMPVSLVELFAERRPPTTLRDVLASSVAATAAFGSTLAASFQVAFSAAVLRTHAWSEGFAASREFARRLPDEDLILALFGLLAVAFFPVTFGRLRGYRPAKLLRFTLGLGYVLALPLTILLAADGNSRDPGFFSLSLLVLGAHLLVTGATLGADALERRIVAWLSGDDAAPGAT